MIASLRARIHSRGRLVRGIRTSLALLGIIAGSSCAHFGRTPDDAPLRVMTYNIHAGHNDLEATAATIRAERADIVALQEVDVHWDARSTFADQATSLGDKLGMQVRFAPIYSLPGAPGAPRREYGVALLSRYAITSFQNHPLTRLSTVQAGTPPSPAPGFLEVALDMDGTTIHVFNTHLDYRADPAVRRTQVAETVAIIGDGSVPTLLFGDFNAPPSAPELQPLFVRLHDAWLGSADEGLTYPADVPVKRIDYVLASRHFRVRSARVPVTQASDHRPVVVELMFERH